MLAPRVLYWAMLLGFGGLLAAEFIKWLGDDAEMAPTTWVASVEPSGFMPDAAFTMLFLILLPVMFSPRTGIWVAFLAVQFENYIATSMGLEPHWWYWPSTVLLGAAALIELSMGLRQFIALRTLRKALEQETPKTRPITDEQAKWAREHARSGRGGFLFLAGVALAAYLAFSWLLNSSLANGPGSGPEPEPFSPFLLAVALGAALWAVVLPFKIAWRMFRARSIGSVLWILPTSDGGPLSVAGKDWLDTGHLSEDEQKRDGCSCKEQTEFEEIESGEEYMDEVHVDLHCAVHGVDAVNSMGTSEFAAMARSKPWVWSPLSDLPITAMGRPIGVLGFAGRGLPGRAGLVEEHEFVAIKGWRGEPSENYVRVREAPGNSDSEPAAKPSTVPRAGRIDELDLRPFGIDGHAQRYKHGHPIFVAADQHGNRTDPNSDQT